MKDTFLEFRLLINFEMLFFVCLLFFTTFIFNLYLLIKGSKNGSKVLNRLGVRIGKVYSL